MPLLDRNRVLVTGGSGFIGTNLIELLALSGADVVNADVRPPLWGAHQASWHPCDISSYDEIAKLITRVDPHMIVHLAARTDTVSDVLADYEINRLGTRNVTRAIKSAQSASRFIFVSTQFVLGPEVQFESETQYAPKTAYGESKAQAERDLIQNPPSVTWTIVRPTNVWGPWHLRYQREFWRILQRGLYLHPASPDPVRSYGYVGSVCLQILAMLVVDSAAVHGRVLYVGDEPIRLSQWVDAFSLALKGRRARRVPGAAIRGLARVGDVAQRIGLPAPLDSGRYRSMTEDYPTPMHRTAEALDGLPRVSLSSGVAETVLWLKNGQSADARSWLASYAAAFAGQGGPRG